MAKSPMDFKTTADLKVPERIVDQVVGQEAAVEVVRKAALQRRHVLLIGEPGTGKSMLGLALAELLPKEKLVDIIAIPNPNDENQPLIRTTPAGKARELVARGRIQNMSAFRGTNMVLLVLAIIISLIPYYLYARKIFPFDNPVVYAASMITGMVFVLGIALVISLSKRIMPQQRVESPKIIVDNYGKKNAPFWDATGAHAGALLGDVLHDPLQSGGLGTPAHERVVSGMIHKAHLGVLFVDEIATLQPSTQQELLTALQEGKYSITGQSERSSGAMVRTEPAPCNFVLVAAGNLETLQHMHPALRSRIRGYGYEIYMKDTMQDTDENRFKIARFVAQEVAKDKRIPHFTRAAVEQILEEARKMANRKNSLTLRLRDLGGLIRAAGDLALEQKAKFVDDAHVKDAKKIARTLEQQIADKFIERKKEYDVIVTEGKQVGRVNGLAVIGGGGSYSGIILPIESEVTPGGKEKEIIATGKLGEIAKEAVKNVSAIIKKRFGKDIKNYDIYVQFLQTYEGVEGDSASIAVATSIISALTRVPVRQDTAMTGSLSVRGEVLPIGGVSAKIEAAIDVGIKQVLVPKSNIQDIVIDKKKLAKIKVIPVETIGQVLNHALEGSGKAALVKKLKT
jgi:Lon-like ATP-dependent protease